MNTPEAQADVGYGGIKAFAFCNGIEQEVASLWNFAKCFLGGLSDHPHVPYIGSHVPNYMVEANKEFLYRITEFLLRIKMHPDSCY